jgi:hypothetical protein
MKPQDFFHNRLDWEQPSVLGHEPLQIGGQVVIL